LRRHCDDPLIRWLKPTAMKVRLLLFIRWLKPTTMKKYVLIQFEPLVKTNGNEKICIDPI